MANTSKKKPTSNNKSKNRSTNTSSARTKVNPAPSKSGFADYFHAFTKTRIFKPLAIIVGIIFVVLLTMLIAWNNYDRFFLILGIELFVIAAIWLFGFLFSMSSDTSKEG